MSENLDSKNNGVSSYCRTIALAQVLKRNKSQRIMVFNEADRYHEPQSKIKTRAQL